jgi:sigma-B regulation protein RsbU (phosphoserine phosphatase)
MSSMRTIPAGPGRTSTGTTELPETSAGVEGPPRARRLAPSPEGAQESSAHTASSPWRAHLEIRLGGSALSRRALGDSHLIIGRIPGVQLLLDHHTVSRRHAEMFCDPFGRWWIRDLASTNGTLVNEEPINEKVLTPGDRIAIGDFVLTFCLEPRMEMRLPFGPLAMEDEQPTAIRTLLDFDPPRIAAEHLKTLMVFGRALINIEEANERLAALCQLLIRSDFHASLAVVLRVKGDEPTLLSRPYRSGTMHPDEPPYISHRVLTKLRETGEPVLAGNLITHPAGGAPSVDLTLSRDVMALWVVAVALDMQDDEMDVLYVTLPPDLGSVEWLSLISLAAEMYLQSESAWQARKHAQAHAAIERELETARQIQRGLIPKKRDFSGLDVAITFEPCKWVGGDYVDAVPMSDGRILFAVADVCGKGLQAALISSSLHTMVRASVDSGKTLPELMERINRHLCDWLPAHSFVTMVAVAIDPVTGQTECVNAGHPPAMIGSPSGELRLLQSAINPALGVAMARMDSQLGTLGPGEVLALYTDGLTELRNNAKEMLGQDRLGDGFARLCEAASTEGVSEIAGGLHQLLESFRGDRLPEDDRAFLLARRA